MTKPKTLKPASVKPVKAWALITPDNKIYMYRGTRLPATFEKKSDAMTYQPHGRSTHLKLKTVHVEIRMIEP